MLRIPPAAVIVLMLLAAPAAAATSDLEARLDGLFLGLMTTHHIPGAVLVVFQRGEVALSKGYGVANLETGAPVDPRTTRFRVASNSKLLVATAVMQQIERGALDLDADVNRYLDGFAIEERFGEPVTLRELLTHTAGFDDRFLHSAQHLEDDPEPLASYLARNMPPRVMRPGRTISYSNHGYALAGHLVGRASGHSFADTIDRDILTPLGMSRSRFGVPTPIPDDMARPYVWREGRHVDIGYDRLLDAPAGDLVTTGADMARFLLAHLHGGRLGDVQILKPESVAAMHRQQVTMAPGLSGWTLGFAQLELDGVDALTHGGSWRGFGTDTAIVPASGDGWFVSTNHDFHPAFFDALRIGLAEIVLGVHPDGSGTPAADFGERAGDYVGSYVANRRVRSTALKLSEVLFEMRLDFDPETRELVLRPASGGDSRVRLIETGPDRFVGSGGLPRAAFLRDEQGAVTRLVIENRALDRLPAWRSPANHARIAVACALFFVATWAGWLLGALVRGLVGGRPSPLTGRARLVGGCVALLLSAFLVDLGLTLSDPNIWDLMIELPPSYRLGLWLPLITLPVALLLPGQLLRGFAPRSRAPLARLHYLILVLASALVLGGAWFWNLVPWKA